MTPSDVWKFIESQSKMAVAFAIDGQSPHLTVVWFCIDHERIYFKGRSYKAKMRLAVSGKASCLWEAGEAFAELRGATLTGTSRIVTEPALRHRILDAVTTKYATSRRVPLQNEANAVTPSSIATVSDDVVVEIIPKRITSWDNRKLASR